MTATPDTVGATGPNLMDPEFIADPVAGYNRLREQAPVVLGTRMDGGPAWYVTRYDDVRAALGDTRFVNNAKAVEGMVVENARDKIVEQFGVPPELMPYINESVLDVDGADHSRLRKLVSRAFTVRRVNAMRPRVEQITAELLDTLTDPTDLVRDFAYPLPITVISELVGVAEAERPQWRQWGAEITSFKPGSIGPALTAMVEHTHGLIERRRAEPADDLLTELIRVQDEEGDRLSEVETVTMVITLVMAGHETTAHLVSAGTLALLQHPDQLELLRNDPSLWPAAVNELLRWCGPVQVTRLRYAVQDVELGGVTIKAGDAVQAVLVSANHDPREFTDPDRLDFTRRPTGHGDGHVGFGHGVHYCLGAALARQEAEVALRMLFDRFPRLSMAAERPEWIPVPGIRRLAALPLHLG
ncbi:cytochrome P450 family protein [Pseudonocardia sp. TRM90224]|uniref:cytochrome P450 family protein n=1 Tax=Pseudonocardia sp. TRM90224 TaxID=2812678 RepID=UPI001E3BBAAD|nr:cytochrome P450 [Pseudonocardia sp. TRM90224]